MQVGPRDLQKHSKWPMFLQMHGSILPRMILPLLVVGSWATCISCISWFTKANCECPLLRPAGFALLTLAPVGISSILLTVTGFVVGLGLSFRSATAYERYAPLLCRDGESWLTHARYAEGRRYWSQLVLACQSQGRVFWVHAQEREGENKERDILAKL